MSYKVLAWSSFYKIIIDYNVYRYNDENEINNRKHDEIITKFITNCDNNNLIDDLIKNTNDL
ncbi:MAG: hypothetical protein Edafosvirus38_7, partial [Edafosvirus sp.]